MLPTITRQTGFLWFVVKDSCVERLFVCASASLLIMMSSHRSRKTLALWLPSSRSSGPLSEVGNLQLAPARPVLRQEEIVREVGGVGHDERVGGKELRRVPELVTSPQTTLPVDTPPLVAVKVQSRLSQSSGPSR